MRAAVEELPERERQIIKLRFGLDGEQREPLPLAQLQRELGMGREECARSSAAPSSSWRCGARWWR